MTPYNTEVEALLAFVKEHYDNYLELKNGRILLDSNKLYSDFEDELRRSELGFYYLDYEKGE